jgi:hypothetical protein
MKHTVVPIAKIAFAKAHHKIDLVEAIRKTPHGTYSGLPPPQPMKAPESDGPSPRALRLWRKFKRRYFVRNLL